MICWCQCVHVITISNDDSDGDAGGGVGGGGGGLLLLLLLLLMIRCWVQFKSNTWEHFRETDCSAHMGFPKRLDKLLNSTEQLLV